MTVEEVIEELMKLNKDATVAVKTHYESYICVSVSLGTNGMVIIEAN